MSILSNLHKNKNKFSVKTPNTKFHQSLFTVSMLLLHVLSWISSLDLFHMSQGSQPCFKYHHVTNMKQMLRCGDSAN